MDGSQPASVWSGGLGSANGGFGGASQPIHSAQQSLSGADLTFGHGNDRVASTFNPPKQYMAFKDRYKEQLLPDNIRSFFLHAREAKLKMANINKETVRLTFGTLSVELVNNYRPLVAKRVVADHELTLYRLTGYVARFLLEQIAMNPGWADPKVLIKIINPISAKLGLTWDVGADLYLSTLPGTEMFIGDFNYYPLAFIILRIRRGEIPKEMATKALRQKIGDRMSAQWMVEDVKQIESAVAKVESLKPVFTGITATMNNFLQHFGIRV
ncbi:N [Ketapang virus]|uniref:Nucleoprotein n=1 Tax=Ketapang virus TaxID=2748196 RepID=A0A7D9MVX3_9VIRU|nr:N [Ketapang virus] [Ketapang virus]QLA47059.1 N [Ketapang virus] [Ketapang virus]